MMKSLGIAVLASFAMAAVSISSSAETVSPETKTATARAAAKALGEKLKSELERAIKTNGTASAIETCKSVGIPLAEEISKSSGMTVRRTSLRVRNQSNAPDPFERKVLESFVKQISQGADPAKLEYSEITTEDGRKAFRYMKAIPTAAQPCLSCHGSDIAPDVSQAIRLSYPDDQATGFKAGELRGAFSITQEIR